MNYSLRATEQGTMFKVTGCFYTVKHFFLSTRACFNFKVVCFFPTQCVYELRLIVTINNYFFPISHFSVGDCYGDGMFPAR